MKKYVKTCFANGCLLVLATLCPAQQTVSEPFDFAFELECFQRQLEFERTVLEGMPKGTQSGDVRIVTYPAPGMSAWFAALSFAEGRVESRLDAEALELLVRRIEIAQPANWQLAGIQFDCKGAFGAGARNQHINLRFTQPANEGAALPERKVANPFDGWRLLAAVATEASGEGMQMSFDVRLSWWIMPLPSRDELTCTVQIFGERFRRDYVQLLQKIHQACEQTGGSFRLSRFSRSAQVLNDGAPGVNGGEYQITIKLGQRDPPDLAEPAVKKKKNGGGDR